MSRCEQSAKEMRVDENGTRSTGEIRSTRTFAE